nr:YoaK family protein [Secundilactobacillus folii]
MATFSMGAIDAYTYIAHDETFASAQTGNMIVFAVKFAQGGIGKAWVNIPIWVGFALGCFVAQATLSWLDSRQTLGRRYLWLMSIVVATMLLAAVGQIWFSELVLIFILGWLSGYELTSFRQLKGTTVNNGIMTGNTKNLMVGLYRWLIDHEEGSRTKFIWLAVTLLTFIVGAGGSAVLCTMSNPDSVMWIIFALNAVGLLGVYFELNRDME